MHEALARSGNRVADYALLREQAESLWDPSLPLFSNLANLSALLKQSVERTNWAGFYLWDEQGSELVLGPFQGLVACTRIAFGRGVCGAAVKALQTQRVADVHLFPGHITCDGASESEIVVPLVRAGPDESRDEVLGVLDIDSPEKNRFDAVDQDGLEQIASLLVRLWPIRSGLPG
jgi:L-methionine (R)-S-oxide reductase